MRNDEKAAEAAQRIAALVRRANATEATTAHPAMLRLTEVLRAFNEDPNTLFVLARAHGRKFPGDRGYRWYHFKRWVRGQERWPW